MYFYPTYPRFSKIFVYIYYSNLVCFCMVPSFEKDTYIIFLCISKAKNKQSTRNSAAFYVLIRFQRSKTYLRSDTTTSYEVRNIVPTTPTLATKTTVQFLVIHFVTWPYCDFHFTLKQIRNHIYTYTRTFTYVSKMLFQGVYRSGESAANALLVRCTRATRTWHSCSQVRLFSHISCKTRITYPFSASTMHLYSNSYRQ